MILIGKINTKIKKNRIFILELYGFQMYCRGGYKRSKKSPFVEKILIMNKNFSKSFSLENRFLLKIEQRTYSDDSENSHVFIHILKSFVIRVFSMEEERPVSRISILI